MITITVGDVLRHAMPDEYFQDTHCIYIVRNGPDVLYVGQAARQSPQERLLQHLAATLENDHHSADSGPSPLGKFVLAHAPQSNDWQVDLLSLADCRGLAGPNRHALTIGAAERLLIRRYAPLLNDVNNPKGQAKPTHATPRLSQVPALPEFSNNYLADISNNRSTQDTYRYALQRFQRYAENSGLAMASLSLQPGQLHRNVLVEFVGWLRRDGAKNNTIRTFVAVVRQYLLWLQAEGKLGALRVEEMEVSLERIAGPHMASIPHEHRTADEAVVRLLRHYADLSRAPFPDTPAGRRRRLSALRNNAIVQTLYSTAGRASEVAALTLSSIDSLNAAPDEFQAKSGRHPVPIETVGRGGRSRPIFLTAQALEAISAYLAARDKSGPIHSSEATGARSGALFVRHDRDDITAVSTKTVWQIVNKAAGEVFGLDGDGRPIKRVGPTDFRHLRAQHLLDDGMPLDMLQAMLGHTSLATTRRTYGDHPSSARLSQKLEEFGRDLDDIAAG